MKQAHAGATVPTHHSHVPFRLAHPVNEVLCTRCPTPPAAPSPPKRVLVPLTPAKPSVTKGKFTLLTYNLLADLYATVGWCLRVIVLD